MTRKNPKQIARSFPLERDKGMDKDETHVSMRISVKMADQMKKIMEDREWTKSQVLREALRLYFASQTTADDNKNSADFPEN